MIKLYVAIYFLIQNIKAVNEDIKIISYIVLGILSPVLLFFLNSLPITWLQDPFSSGLLVISVLVLTALYFLYKLVKNEKQDISISYVETLFLFVICFSSAPLKILFFLLLTSIRFLRYHDDSFEVNLRFIFMLLFTLMLFSPLSLFSLRIMFAIFLLLELVFIENTFDKLCFLLLSSSVFSIINLSGYTLYLMICVLVLWLSWNKLTKTEQGAILGKMKLLQGVRIFRNYSIYKNIKISNKHEFLVPLPQIPFLSGDKSFGSRNKSLLKSLVPEYVFVFLFCLFILYSLGVLWEVI
ncbi:MAG: hypothetical protein CME62_17280 [Halobacteriovoraceae bacterium]|nr:hypothetical protein [Halobacteriovoraceae bacterium]|tara:strand:- start:6592 stop:7482 length:891 start_codon:yes stop_codon:yes gene_type:complete